MKSKRFIMALMLVGVISVSFLGTVYAAITTTYRSSLSLGSGMSLVGGTRNYPLKGNMKLSIKPNWLENGSTKVRVSLDGDTGTSCVRKGTKDYSMNSTGTTYKKTVASSVAAGNYFYVFTTKVDGVSYGGITTASNGVVMTSETN